MPKDKVRLLPDVPDNEEKNEEGRRLALDRKNSWPCLKGIKIGFFLIEPYKTYHQQTQLDKASGKG